MGRQKLVFEAKDLAFAYRSSNINEQGIIITGVELRLKPGDKSLIREQVRKYVAIRQEKQPQCGQCL